MGDRNTSVLEQYDFQVLRTGRGRGAVLCETNCGLKLLKEYTGTLERLSMEDEILNLIKDSGGLVDNYMRNSFDRVLSIDGDGTKYVVKNWFEARECDVRSMTEILAAVRTLAKLHKILEVIPERLKEGLQSFQGISLEREIEKHHRELKRARSFMRNKHKKSEFELQVLHNFEQFYQQGEEALKMLHQSAYTELRNKALDICTVCHGNYNQHNVLVYGRRIAIINFDKMCVNLQITDLYLFMRKILEKHNWDNKLGMAMLEEYQKEKIILEEEYDILLILFSYPEKFWKVVNHYYNNNKAWIPQKDIDKLNVIVNQNDEKRKFIEKMKGV